MPRPESSETPTPARYETRQVLGGAYPQGRLTSLLTHTVDAATERPLCSRVKPESIADVHANDPGETEAPPTCKACLARDPRSFPVLNV